MNVSRRVAGAVAAACMLSLSFWSAGLANPAAPARHQGSKPAKQAAAKPVNSSAPRKLHVVATGYTPNCAGCSGTTRTGAQAGHGVAAVDPHVIPLGTKLYVPGYGHALAGDTGGDIKGRRVDLGFNSERQAQHFGRRKMVVYELHGKGRHKQR